MTTSPTPRTSSAAPGSSAEFAEALIAEYAAIFLYGSAGAQMTGTARSAAAADLDDHRRGRDWLRAAMLAAGASPPPPAPAYDTAGITDEATAVAAVQQAELALIPRWAALGGVVTGDQRAYCAGQCRSAATRAMRWGAASAAFPGTTAPASPADSAPTAGAGAGSVGTGPASTATP